MSNNRRRIEEKMNNLYDESITSESYRSEKVKEKLQLRKNKIFNILFSKRKEVFKNDEINSINDIKLIDINKLNCDEEIKKDVINYIKTKFNIKNWFKYIFSSDKNDIQVSLYLIVKFIELQIYEKKEENRQLSRNNSELIKRLCQLLLNDDIKIMYNAAICLTNLTFFPKNIENRIYSEENLDTILKFFNIFSNNLTSFGYKPLFLFLNISTNMDVRIYLIKHSFLQNLYNLMNDIINNKNNVLNETIQINSIKYCICILSQLIHVIEIDDNYINGFLPFVPICKLITNNYYVNIDFIMKEENYEPNNLLLLWDYYSKDRYNHETIIKEILKDNFLKVLILLYYKIKEDKLKEKMIILFDKFLNIGNEIDKILINDGIIKFFNDEIDKCQYSKTELVSKIAFTCSNLTYGDIGQLEILFESGIIFKIIDITSFHIDDNLDNEIKELLINCLFLLVNCILPGHPKIKINILNYKKCIIINLICKALKRDLDPNNKRQLVHKIIYAINELNVSSEELEPYMQKEYNMLLISNSLEELLNIYQSKKSLENSCKLMIEDIITFIKNLEEDV